MSHYSAPPPERDPRLHDGLALFDAGEYYRSHDVLEEMWFDEVGQVKQLLKGLIQLAVAAYHRENGNLRGAAILFERAQREVFAPLPDELLGFDIRDLERRAGRLGSEADARLEDPSAPKDSSALPSFRLWREQTPRDAPQDAP